MTNPATTDPRSACPDCGTALAEAPGRTVGEIVECGACGSAFEVAALRPFTLIPFEEEEK